MKPKPWMIYAVLGSAIGVFAAERASSREPERASQSAEAALQSLPADLRPARPRIELSPRVTGLEYDRASGSILVGPGGADAERGVWLHELAHSRLAGARPKGALALRLTDAIEEGVADYFAATLGQNPVLGSGVTARDLREPPKIGDSEWASLAFDGFDTHRMGWALASRLYEADPNGGSLLRDFVACLDGDSALGSAAESPASVIQALLEACPVAGRSRIARVISAWLPPELYSVEIPT